MAYGIVVQVHITDNEKHTQDANHMNNYLKVIDLKIVTDLLQTSCIFSFSSTVTLSENLHCEDTVKKFKLKYLYSTLSYEAYQIY